MVPALARRLLVALPLCAVAAAVGAASDADYSQRLATLVNEYRASHQLPALAVDARIANLAHEHSAAMAKSRKMGHAGFPERVKRSGLAMCVENVGWNYATPEQQFEAWRTSPGHDRNMLDPRVERIGTGVDAAYVTMIACGK